MGHRLDSLIQRIRQEKGPFFIARLCLRLDFPVDPGAIADSDARVDALVTACRALGFDPVPPRFAQH